MIHVYDNYWTPRFDTSITPPPVPSTGCPAGFAALGTSLPNQKNKQTARSGDDFKLLPGFPSGCYQILIPGIEGPGISFAIYIDNSSFGNRTDCQIGRFSMHSPRNLAPLDAGINYYIATPNNASQKFMVCFCGPIKGAPCPENPC